VRASAVSASPFRSQWVLFSTTITKHEVDTTLRRIERGVAHGGVEPWAQAPDPRFSSHRVRDAQRTRSLLVDRDSDRIAIVAPESRAASAQALAAIPATAAPATPNHAVLVTLDDLSAIASVPGLSDRGHWLTLDLVPGGGARAVAHVACVNAMAAEALAASLRETVGWKNSLMVRLVTRSLLSQFDASAEGAAVTISLPASDAQLSAAVNLLAGEMGVPPPMMYGADAGAPSGSLPSR